MQHLNYGGQESKIQFAGYDSYTPWTLIQGQGHQTCYDFIDPKEDYKTAKFEKHHMNSVYEKSNIKTFGKSANT